jgi:hypothetical protein
MKDGTVRALGGLTTRNPVRAPKEANQLDAALNHRSFSRHVPHVLPHPARLLAARPDRLHLLRFRRAGGVAEEGHDHHGYRQPAGARGFGLQAKLAIGWPGWIFVKMVCWLGLSALAGIGYRRRGAAGTLAVVAILLSFVAVLMVYTRPF